MLSGFSHAARRVAAAKGEHQRFWPGELQPHSKGQLYFRLASGINNDPERVFDDRTESYFGHYYTFPFKRPRGATTLYTPI